MVHKHHGLNAGGGEATVQGCGLFYFGIRSAVSSNLEASWRRLRGRGYARASKLIFFLNTNTNTNLFFNLIPDTAMLAVFVNANNLSGRTHFDDAFF